MYPHLLQSQCSVATYGGAHGQDGVRYRHLAQLANEVNGEVCKYETPTIDAEAHRVSRGEDAD